LKEVYQILVDETKSTVWVFMIVCIGSDLRKRS
jgi:hypothetical protein